MATITAVKSLIVQAPEAFKDKGEFGSNELKGSIIAQYYKNLQSYSQINRHFVTPLIKASNNFTPKFMRHKKSVRWTTFILLSCSE